MLGLDNAFKKIFGSANDRFLKRLRPTVAAINELEPRMQAMSDEELAGMTVRFKERLDQGASLDDLLVEAFAVVREAARRTVDMRPFDVQLIGGIVLHQGRVAEMKTGEGKTLVATMPVYLNGLTGKGVHVVTVNDYLAERDAEWMGKVYRFLGLSVGKILSNERNDAVKRAAYAADVTYGTNNEFGFDYLRDNMKFRLEDMVQRGHHYAIVDEVDSILIDEARTPLIISGPTNFPVDRYYLIDSVIPLLQNELDFVIDEKDRQVSLTDEGITKVEQKLGIDNLYDPHNMEILHHVNQALRAHMLYKRDKDYVVQDGKVIIVDEHTGRLMHGRRWSDGLHQAIEAKERLKVEPESQTYATITFQNYFRMYDKLAGMTGTAETEAAEFAKIYDLEVVVIPTNLPVARVDEHDIVYRTQEEKFRAVLEDIVAAHEKGQPVLVGTTSVEKSEIVSRMLQRKRIPHELLNAKNHAREGRIIAQAGRLGAVTISTNMAGRGTDIKLGGNPEELARDAADPETEPEAYAEALERFRRTCEEEREKVLEVGGLRVIGTERHESRRIDNQLRGRSGRQGDPGSSKFYLSLEDDLLRRFGSDKILAFMERFGLEDDEPIESRMITRSIESAQKKVEAYNFNIRKNLLEYDDVLNQQRKSVYQMRRRALEGENIRGMMLEAIEGVVDDIVDDHAPDGVHPEEWDVAGMRARLEKVFGIRWEGSDEEIRDLSHVELRKRMHEDALELFRRKEEALGEDTALQVERMLLLQYTDQLWKDHLLAMDRLRDGIGLRGYGQRNPLLEYKKEGFNMFMMMNALRDEYVVSRFLRVELQPPVQAEPAAQAEAPAVPRTIEVPPPRVVQRPAPGQEAREWAQEHGVGRNDPCPCGSGRKFKKCCLKVGAAV